MYNDKDRSNYQYNIYGREQQITYKDISCKIEWWESDIGLPIAAVMLDVVRIITFGDDFNLSIWVNNALTTWNWIFRLNPYYYRHP